MPVGVNPRAEDGGAYPDHIGSTGDGGLIIGAHAHRQKIHAYIIVFFSANVNKKLIHSDKIWLDFLPGGANRGDGHQSPDPDRGKLRYTVKGGGQFCRGKTGLGSLGAYVYLQKYVLYNAPGEGGFVDQTDEFKAVRALDQGGKTHHLLHLVFLQMPDKMELRALVGALGLLFHHLLDPVFAADPYSGGDGLPDPAAVVHF